MESPVISPDTIQKSLLDEGFIDLHDLEAGEYIWEFEQKEFPFTKEDGMDFLKQYILNNPAIKSIIKYFFKDQGCVLVHCLRYRALPGHIESFLGGRDAGRRALMIDLLAKGTRVGYYAKSHLHTLPAKTGERSTRELSRSTLQEAGCKAYLADFSTGGLVILDARLGREIQRGYIITAIFMTEDLVTRFKPPPMRLPNLPGVKKKVAEMQAQANKIRLNFIFGDSIGNAPV